VKQDIQNAVRNGNIVTIPEEEIRYFDWKGAAYIVLDPETGSAAYRIGGGINGGSTSIKVDLALAVTIIDALLMLYGSAILLSGGTLAILGGFFLYALSVYFIAQIMTLSYQYYVLNDESAGDAIITEALWSLAGAGGGFALSKLPRLLSHLPTLIDNIKRFGDQVAGGFATRLAINGYSDEFIYAFIKNNGSSSLHASEDLLGQLNDVGISKSFLNNAKHLDNNDLSSLLNLVNRGYDEAQLVKLMDDGIKLDDIIYFASRNVDPSDYSKYGMINHTETTWVKRYIQEKGFSPTNIEELVIRGLKPSELQILRITETQDINRVIEYLDNVPSGERISYANRFESELKNFNDDFAIREIIDQDLYLVNYHPDVPIGQGRSLKFWTTTLQANQFKSIDDVMNSLALLSEWGARDRVSIAKIPAGTQVKYASGTALEQVNKETEELRPGGGYQILFEEFDPSWIINPNSTNLFP
jgi:hypothetical protein